MPQVVRISGAELVWFIGQWMSMRLHQLQEYTHQILGDAPKEKFQENLDRDTTFYWFFPSPSFFAFPEAPKKPPKPKKTRPRHWPNQSSRGNHAKMLGRPIPFWQIAVPCPHGQPPSGFSRHGPHQNGDVIIRRSRRKWISSMNIRNAQKKINCGP